MSTFSEGDLVEATRSHTLIRGRLNGLGQMPGVGRSPESLALDGYTVTLIEKAAPALPTEPGFYLDAEGDIWALRGRWWKCLSGAVPDMTPAEYLPMLRLEPVEDTAKKVTQFVLDWIGAAGIYTDEQCLAAVAAEFGVTS